MIAHVPIFCEEKSIPYVYVPSKEELGAASQTKRPTSIVLVSCKPDSDFKDTYDECKKEYSLKIWKQINAVFDCLPFTAILEEKILCVHAGSCPNRPPRGRVGRLLFCRLCISEYTSLINSLTGSWSQ